MLVSSTLLDLDYAKKNFSGGNRPYEPLENLYQDVQNVIFIKDVNYEYVYVNRAFEQNFGLNRLNIIGKTDFDIFCKEEANVILRSDKKALLFREAICEKEKFNIDGREKYFLINKVPLFNENGELIGIGGIGTNITDQLNLEEKLNKLRETQYKYFSIIAHDLKNPFNSILGIAEILKSNIEEYSKDDLKELISSLHTSSQKAIDLFENLLNWSMAQWREEEKEDQYTNLHLLVEESIAAIKVNAKEKNILIKNKVNRVININTDKNSISTVIRNLVNNAIKFTYQGGEVKIEANVFKKVVEIIISDDGKGMSDEKIDTIFNIQKNNSTDGTNNEKGVGLGLLICKEFVEKCGGKIWVEKTKSRGSEFHFTIMPDS